VAYGKVGDGGQTAIRSEPSHWMAGVKWTQRFETPQDFPTETFSGSNDLRSAFSPLGVEQTFSELTK
jgi:hypothetical protein